MNSNLRICLAVVLGLAMLTTGAAAAPFFDDFESYAAGSNLHGQGGWKGWDNDGAYGAFASNDRAFSGSISAQIIGTSDLVHEFDATGGQWTVSAMQYIPGNATGETFFILMNQYADGAAADKDWSTQLNFNMNTNKVGSVNLVRDQWKEVRVEVDLVGNTRREYYDNNLIATDIWYGPNGAAKIAAIDLYGNNASPVYYDDLRVAPVPEPGTVAFLLGSLVTLPWFRRRRVA